MPLNEATSGGMIGRTRTPGAAALAFELASTYCNGCQSYHGIWPYLRLVDPPRGVDADRVRLIETLEPLLGDGVYVLLAGSADAGLAECVLDAAGAQFVSLDIIDLCETPLRQCVALLGKRAVGGLRTWKASITGKPVASPVDIVIAHSVLSFLLKDQVEASAAFVRESLRPGGRLVMTTSLKGLATANEPELFRRYVLEGLATQDVLLPVSEATFVGLIDDYAIGRYSRTSPFASEQDVIEWLTMAGLEPETIEPLARGNSITPQGQIIARSGRGLLVVARRAN